MRKTLAAALTLCLFAVPASAKAKNEIVVSLKTSTGEDAGTATFQQEKIKLSVKLELKNLPVGEHAVHIHAKVHVGAYITDGLAQGGHVTHTGQFFFTEDLTRAVSKLAPYRSNKTPRTTNAQDMHYNRGGAAGLLSVVPRDRHHLPDGLLSTITVSVDPDATPALV